MHRMDTTHTATTPDAIERRTRAAVACLVMAATTTDDGEAGYSEGVAERMIVNAEPVSADYMHRVEVAAMSARRTIESVGRSGRVLTIEYPWGSRRLCAPTANIAAAVADQVAGAKA